MTRPFTVSDVHPCSLQWTPTAPITPLIWGQPYSSLRKMWHCFPAFPAKGHSWVQGSRANTMSLQDLLRCRRIEEEAQHKLLQLIRLRRRKYVACGRWGFVIPSRGLPYRVKATCLAWPNRKAEQGGRQDGENHGMHAINVSFAWPGLILPLDLG